MKLNSERKWSIQRFAAVLEIQALGSSRYGDDHVWSCMNVHTLKINWDRLVKFTSGISVVASLIIYVLLHGYLSYDWCYSDPPVVQNMLFVYRAQNDVYSQTTEVNIPAKSFNILRPE